MKLKKIRVKNIRSYKDQEINFPEGSLLISGDIGSGKTSILLAIEYALFGLQPGQKGNSLLRNNEQSAEVDLELEIEEKSILIERRLKRTPKGVSNEYAAISINGEKEEASLTEIKLKVVNLLRYPSEFVKKNNILYRYTVHSPQEQMKQIILEDPESRLNILRHVFGVDKYKRIKNNLSILLATLKNDSKLLQGSISTLDQDIINLKLRKSNIGILDQKIKINNDELKEKEQIRLNCEKELSGLNKKIEEKLSLERELEKTKILLITKKELLNSLNNEIEDLKKSIFETGEPFNEQIFFTLIDKIKTKRQELEEINTDLVNLKSEISSLTQEKKTTLTRKERIFRIDICPTCLQDVPESYKHNIMNETEKRISEIEKKLQNFLIKEKETYENVELRKKDIYHLEENKVKLEILKSKLEHLENSKIKVGELVIKKKSIENDESMLLKHLNGLKENISKFTVFEIQFNKKEQELKSAFMEEKKVEILLAESKKELEISLKEIGLFEQDIKKKEESKMKLVELNELIDWLSTQFVRILELTERNVLLKLRSEFSSLFRNWFLMLVPENAFDSQLDDNFTPIIMQGETEMDYSFLSGGERTAVALAYRLALNQTINSLLSKIRTRGIIILDEPTDGFSDAQIDKMREIFEELNAKQLIIVSHEQKMEGFVDNVLKVAKDSDSSFIQVETPQNLNT